MNLTSNFDYCVELGIGPLKAIFHLALKNEDLFPHNVGPFQRTYSGEAVSVSVRLIDDDDSPADLSLADAKHIAFSLPIEITAQIPDAPDPSLAQVTLRSTIVAPGALATWTGDDGEPVLGIDFTGITPADVTVPSVDGLPQLDASRFEAAIHTKYDTIPHTYALGGNTLNLYDGSRDPTLSPPNGPGNPAITATLDPPGPSQFLNVALPLHADVPQAVFHEYGTAAFSRPVTQGDGSVSVDMGAPDDPAHPTTITFVGGHPAESLVKAQLTPLLVSRLAAFGKITEPWFTEAFAKTVLAQEAASYLAGRKYPMYTPKSGDPENPVTTPVGFLLPADGVLAILMTLRSGTVDAATAPDNFLGAEELALAVGRVKLDETISKAIDDAFPGLEETGSYDLKTKHGDATMHSLTVTPSDPGDHGQSEGHLWAQGTATVHIPCWPDPDVSFDGPIFLHLNVTETDTTCDATIDPVMGDFDAGESCCDVFVDLIIPIIGWIMLAVVEDTIDKVGGELASDYATKEATRIQAIPPVVVGVAELQSCLEGLNVSTDGLVFPGKLRIRRDGTSFEDLAASGELPRP